RRLGPPGSRPCHPPRRDPGRSGCSPRARPAPRVSNTRSPNTTRGSSPPITPAMAARLGSTTTIHSWIFNNTAIYGSLSEQSVRLAEYLIELGRGRASDPNRPIWLQEIGAPLPPLTGNETVEFLRRSVEHALD